MEIKKIAQLAYLLVDEENFEKDLSAILSYVDKLKELDTSQVEETAYLFSFSDTLREDVEERKETKDIVDLMPKTQNNYLEVQEVFLKKMSDLTKLTIKELRQGLKDKVFSSQEITKEFLKQIEEKDKESEGLFDF